MDQRTLVEHARHGDRDAFAVLARANAARLDAAARLIVRDRELARDAVQEALIRAWRDLPGLRDPARFDAWLHRLLVNAAIDEARRRRRRVIEVELTPIDAPTSDDNIGLLADRDALERALGQLAPEHRALVVLHYYLGMPLPEAAASLGISLGAAKSRLHRAIGSMRQAFIGGQS
ncbi:MAG: sigma-70 family RNA polymerase sigma factor [Chloroflexota bacterium]|nr:sigma-70 family RNA polymerase sigma factor [Chloroflexota bacterium]